MRAIRPATIGVILACVLGAGCGGSGESSSVEFKPTDTTPLNPMKDQMTKSLQTRSYQRPPRN